MTETLGPLPSTPTLAGSPPSSGSHDSPDTPPLIPLLVLPASNLLLDPPAKPTQADAEFCRKHGLKYDCHIKTLDKEPSLNGKFLRVGLDSHTRIFLEECLDQFASVTHSVRFWLKPALSLVYSHTDLNGLLNTGQMSIISTNQLRILFANELARGGGQLGRLLDVGAGCGRITSLLAPLFSSVTATEVSPVMVAKLKALGFHAVQAEDLDEIQDQEGFDVVSILNVIDRCDKPVSLLQSVRKKLKGPCSRVILATPLPLRPSVETKKGWVKPSQDIVDRSRCIPCEAPACCMWEMCVQQITTDYFLPNGFIVQSVSRLPYLSQGDRTRPYYVLDDAVFVLAPLCTQKKFRPKFHLPELV